MVNVALMAFLPVSPSVAFHVTLYVGWTAALNAACNAYIYVWRSREWRRALTKPLPVFLQLSDAETTKSVNRESTLGFFDVRTVRPDVSANYGSVCDRPSALQPSPKHTPSLVTSTAIVEELSTLNEQSSGAILLKPKSKRLRFDNDCDEKDGEEVFL